MAQNNFHQPDPRRKGSGDGNDGPNPSTGNGDMLKSVYDSNDDGRVNSADHATSATSADDLSGAAAANFLQYYGKDELGNVGFHDLPSGGGGGSSTFLELTDTPASYLGAAGYKVVVNGTEDGLELVVDSGGGGATDFTDLGDVPSSYAGMQYHLVRVNDSETGLEFVPASSGSGQEVTEKTTALTGFLPDWAYWLADTSSTALTRGMPLSPTDGMEVTVRDSGDNAATNNVTITVFAPTTIEDAVLNEDGVVKKWRYDSTGDVWDLVFSKAPSTGGGGTVNMATRINAGELKEYVSRSSTGSTDGALQALKLFWFDTGSTAFNLEAIHVGYEWSVNSETRLVIVEANAGTYTVAAVLHNGTDILQTYTEGSSTMVNFPLPDGGINLEANKRYGIGLQRRDSTADANVRPTIGTPSSRFPMPTGCSVVGVTRVVKNTDVAVSDDLSANLSSGQAIHQLWYYTES